MQGVSGKTVAILGLAFKPETDDMRESPSIPLILGLQARGAKIRAYDPEAMERAGEIFEGITFCEDAYQTCEGAHAVVIVTEWNEFRALNMEKIMKALEQPVMVDLRNVYDHKRMKAAGFAYTSVGRGAVREPKPRKEKS
jgi:UDPglucose 6-dehydrogenase